MDQPINEQAPPAPLPIEPGHLMNWEKYWQMVAEQQQ